jgi:arylsulfatase A-like enzyme
VQATAPPNVLWVIWDTVRAQNLSVYGYERPTTPHLDEWAKRARVFENAVSAASITTSSHASMFTGLLPFEHAVGNGHSRLALSFQTVAEVLSGAGYRTYLFSANPYLGPETALDQGFQASERPTSPSFERSFARHREQKVRDYVRAGRPAKEFGFLAASGSLAHGGLLAWLERTAGDAPFFAVLNYMEAHLPLAPERRFRERFMTPEQVKRSYEIPLHGMPVWAFTTGVAELSQEEIEIARRVYDAAIAELDELFRDLLVELEQRGHLDDTLVILTSDHGELLGEHHMWNHQYALYEELLRVPLILHGPGRVAPGRDPRPVMNLDLFRTVLELAGSEVPGPGAKGVSLLAPAESRVRLSEYTHPAGLFLELVKRKHPDFHEASFDRSLRALQSGDLKYIWASDGRHELYDLGSDPGEGDDLAGERRAQAERLDQELRRLTAAGSAAEGAAEAAQFDGQTRVMLEALGYAADGEEH